MWLRVTLAFGLLAVTLAEVKPCEYGDKIYRINGNSIDFPCESTKNIFITTERFKPSSIIPLRFQIDKKHDRALVVLPRLRTGIPITFGVIDLKKPNCYTHIKPYPCWPYQEEGNCNSFQSVVDAYIDVKVRTCLFSRRRFSSILTIVSTEQHLDVGHRNHEQPAAADPSVSTQSGSILAGQ